MVERVEVNVADLEAIIQAAGIIKTIEGALASRRTDPFVKPYLDFTDAHNRLTAAWRDAQRAEADTLVKYDAPLTREEVNALQYVAAGAPQGAPGGATYFTISPEDKGEPGREMSVYDQLSAKGLIRIGQWCVGVVWPGASQVSDVKPDPKGYAAQLTERGARVLWEVVDRK